MSIFTLTGITVATYSDNIFNMHLLQLLTFLHLNSLLFLLLFSFCTLSQSYTVDTFQSFWPCCCEISVLHCQILRYPCVREYANQFDPP